MQLSSKEINKMRKQILQALTEYGIVLLPPMDVIESMQIIHQLKLNPKVTMLDPWYNKGKGGVIERSEYDKFIKQLLRTATKISDHVYLWGFPEIIARFVDCFPSGFKLTAWLTWYYKNAPSRTRGWRPSQMACIHYSKVGTVLYPEHFMNSKQLEKRAEGKLTFIPGPTSVIEESLLVGFVGKNEQTGHPAQKPVSVFKKLILMVTLEQEIIFDPMCGSGTTGDAAKQEGRYAILCDESEEFTQMVEQRLNIRRINFDI